MERLEDCVPVIGQEVEDSHKFPFSVFKNARQSDGQLGSRKGSVREVMDKVIGRKAFRIRGNVSANNYLEISRLHLQGDVIYVQLKTIDEFHAAFHMEIAVRSGPLTVSFSSLHNKPTYLGHGLRLPLNLRPGVWTTIAIRPEELLAEYTPFKRSDFKFVRRFQMCANMYVRDIVTSDREYTHTQEFPKELTFNPNLVARTKDLIDDWVMWCPPKPQPRALETRSEATELDLENVHQNRTPRSVGNTPRKTKSPHHEAVSGSVDKLHLSLDTGSTSSHSEFQSPRHSTPRAAKVEPEEKASIVDRRTAQSPRVRNSPTSKCSAGRPTPTKAVRTTPRTANKNSSDTELILQRVLQYSGSLCAFADKDTAIIASNNLLVFQTLSDRNDVQEEVQHFHQLHSHPVTTFAVSRSGRMLVTAHRGPYPALCLYDLHNRACLAVASYWGDIIEQVVFSNDERFLATVGLDAHRRVQITIWNVEAMILMKNTGVSNKSVVAKQTSDFPVHKIKFSPLDSQHLISCGRENVRFWRVKKEHLPAQSAVLNEYARGTMFTDLGVAPFPGAVPGSRKDANQVQLFVTTDTGCLLQFDYANRVVLQAFKLHNQAIRSFELSAGYAVTGGDDCILRIWPLDFTDFLLEAHHEAPVTSLAASQDGERVLVGTASGTLGVLDVSHHGYRTVLRSHVGPVLAVAVRPGVSEEFATIGTDHTIRIWEAIAGQQKFEFNSPGDLPTCITYHPTEHVIVCGFRSGFVRVFDVPGTSTLHEVHSHQAEVHNVIFDPNGFRLYSCCVDHQIAMYDARRAYQTVRVITCDGISSRLQLAINHSGSLLAVSGYSVGSITLLDASRMVPVQRFERNALREQPFSRPQLSAFKSHSLGMPAPDDNLLVGEGGVLELFDDVGDADTNEVRRIGFFKSGTVAVFTTARLVLFWPPEPGQTHWERSVVRLPSSCPAEFCTIREETQLALLFQRNGEQQLFPQAPTPTELCIFRLEQERSTGKLNWSTSSGAHPKLSLTGVQTLQLLHSTITGLAVTEAGNRLIVVDNQGAVRIWSTCGDNDDLALRSETRSDLSQPTSPVKLACDTASESDGIDTISTDEREQTEAKDNPPTAPPRSTLSRLRAWQSKQPIMSSQVGQSGKFSFICREHSLRTVNAAMNGFSLHNGTELKQTLSSNGELLVQWDHRLLMIRNLATIDSISSASKVVSVSNEAETFVTAAMIAHSDLCVALRRSDDEFVLSTLGAVSLDPLPSAKETAIRMETGGKFGAMVAFSSRTVQGVLLAFTVPSDQTDSSARSGASRRLHLLFFRASVDGSMHLEQQLLITTPVAGPVISCTIHGSFAQISTSSAVFVVCLPADGQFLQLAVMQTIALIAETVNCSAFIHAASQAWQLCIVTDSGYVCVHTPGSTTPRRNRLLLSSRQQCTCILSHGDNLFVGINDGEIFSIQLKENSVEQELITGVEGRISSLQMIGEHDLLICHARASVSLHPDATVNRRQTLNLIYPFDDFSSGLDLLPNVEFPTGIRKTDDGQVEIVSLVNGKKIWNTVQCAPDMNVMRFTTFLTQWGFRAGIVTESGLATFVDSLDLSSIQPIHELPIPELRDMCFLDNGQQALLGSRAANLLLVAFVNNNVWELQAMETHVEHGAGFVFDRLVSDVNIPGHACISYVANKKFSEYTLLLQVVKVLRTTDRFSSTVAVSLSITADHSPYFMWLVNCNHNDSNDNGDDGCVWLLAVVSSDAGPSIYLAAPGDSGTTSLHVNLPTGFTADDLCAFFCLNRYLVVSNQDGQLAIYRLRLRTPTLEFTRCICLHTVMALSPELTPASQVLACDIDEVQAVIRVTVRLTLSDGATRAILQLALPLER